MDHNPASIFEVIADTVGEHPALAHRDLVRSWSDFDGRAAQLAGSLAEWGVGPSDKVACYLYNGPEYLETCYATLKRQAVPVNVNYRYLHDELRYLLDNSDAKVIVFHGSLGERVAEVAPELPGLVGLVQVDDGAPLVEGAVWMEDVIGSHRPEPRHPRSDDDIVMLYTGGTTGMPKGVMYRCGDVYGATLRGIAAAAGRPAPATPGELGSLVEAIHHAGLAPVLIPAAPLMHGAGIASSLQALLTSGTVVTLASRSFDGAELWEAAERHRVTVISIVGDAFARPLADALDRAAAAGTPYQLSSVREIHSTGTMFSLPEKERLLSHLDVTLIDNLASSEAPGMAVTRLKRGGTVPTATFKLGPTTIVVSEDGRQLEPGSQEVGMLAVGGVVPVGYYKDPEKSARTFPVIDGRRYAVPGDFARVDPDGTVVLLGRGSACINSGGEKVFPEEVEEAVKEAPGVVDCLVVGLPDERLGERVVAVASVASDATAGEQTIRDFVRARLAGYKVPRQVVLVDRVQRAPNGKADYPWARETAATALGEG